MRLYTPPSDWPLLAYVAAMPTCALAAYTFSNHDAARIAQLATLLLTALIATARCLGVGNSNVGRPETAAQLVVALAVTCTLLAEQPDMACRETALIFGLAATAWLVADRWTATSLAPARLAVWLGSASYAFVLALLALSTLVTREPIDWASLAVGYDNYRFLNHVQSIALPLLAIVAIHRPTERYARLLRGGAWFSMTVFWTFVFCSGARGTALAVVVALALTGIMTGWRDVWPVGRTLAATAALGAVTYGIVFTLLPAAGLLPIGASAGRSLPSLGSDSSRMLLWREAWEDIVASPWLGVGPMHYAHDPNPKGAHPHNIYLQVAAEWGVPMLMLLLALTWQGLRSLQRTIRDVNDDAVRAEGVGLLVACMAILVDGLVSGNFVMPVSQMWIALCLAWALAWARLQRQARVQRPAGSFAWPRALAAALLVSQSWLVADVWTEAYDLRVHFERIPRDVAPHTRPSPRFWSDGWF